MDRLEVFKQGLRTVSDELASKELEPDAARKDWPAVRGRVRAAASEFTDQVLSPLEEVLAEVVDDERVQIRAIVAHLAGGLAAVALASGDRDLGSDLLARASCAAFSADARAEADAAVRETDSFVTLAHGRWLRARGKLGRAERLFRGLAKSAREPALRQAAEAALDVPSPIKAAPTLFTINGCGVRLYGRRDQRPDGSYIATLFITAVFVPVFPLAAYRIADAQGGSYYFLGKVPLWRPLRWFQRSVAAATALALVAGAAYGYWTSEWRRSRLAVQEAQGLERSSHDSEALAAYERAIRDFGAADPAVLRSAVEGWLRIRVKGMHEPFARDQVDGAERIVRWFQEVAPAAAAGAPSAQLASHLQRWAGQLGSTPEDMEAALRVLDLAASVGGDVRARQQGLRRELVKILSEPWPLQALEHAVGLSDHSEAAAAAAPLLASIGSDPALLQEVRLFAERWLVLAGAKPEYATVAKQVREGLEWVKSQTADAARAKLLEEGEERKLLSAHKKAPGDQALAVALARSQANRGALEAAIATLERVGKPGRLGAPGQLLLATCWAAAGRLEEADRLLERVLAYRLPRYRAAQGAFEAAAREKQQRLVAAAQAGDIPADLNLELQGKSEEEKGAIFRAWLGKKLSDDAEIASLSAALRDFDDVVPAAMELGTLKLRRWQAAEPATRERLMEDAERVLLAIRQEAEGAVSFHLGLGQVYHRLGKTQEGERELNTVLEKAGPEVRLAVAKTYRELGMNGRTTEVLMPLVGEQPSQIRTSALTLLAVISGDVLEREKWLSMADASDGDVKVMLAEARGMRLLREARFEEADRELATVTAHYLGSAKHSPIAANNAAVSFMHRFYATRDPAKLDSAVSQLEAAVRLYPDNSLILGNLAGLLEDRAELAALGGMLQVRNVVPSTASELLRILVEGTDGARAVERLATDRVLRRALELTRRVQILAPRSAEGYERERRWLRVLRDQEALVALAGRLERVPPLDHADALKSEARAKDHASDEPSRQATKADLKVLDQIFAGLDKAPSGADLGAAYVQKALLLKRLAFFDADAAHFEAMVAALRKAEAAWPGCATHELGDALFYSAIAGAAKESPALAAVLEDGWRGQRLEVALHAAVTKDPAALAALRRQPALAEAAQVHRSAAGARLSLDDWLLAWLAQDDQLLASALSELNSPESAANERIMARLGPDNDPAKAQRALLAQATGRAGAGK